MYVPPPAPEHHRSPIVAPKFNPPNLSAPRPRFKSRGVKPAPEDAIRRDPRAITLYNELAQGRGVVVTTIAWEATRRGEGRGGSASATPGSSATPTPRAGSATPTPRASSTTPPPSARSAGGGAAGSRPGSASPAASAGSSAAATPRTPTPRLPSPSPKPLEAELSEEEAAAYLPTLPARALAVTAFEPRSLQEVSDFVSDVRAQGGDAPRSGHAACAFPTRKWAVMAEAAATFDALLDACDTLHKWECPPQVRTGVGLQQVPQAPAGLVAEAAQGLRRLPRHARRRLCLAAGNVPPPADRPPRRHAWRRHRAGPPPSLAGPLAALLWPRRRALPRRRTAWPTSWRARRGWCPGCRTRTTPCGRAWPRRACPGTTRC